MKKGLPYKGRGGLLPAPMKKLLLLLMFVAGMQMNVLAQGNSCTNATLLTVDGTPFNAGSITDSSISTTHTCTGTEVLKREAWFKFVATSTTAYVSVTANRDPALYGYSACSGNPTPLWCANDVIGTGGQTEKMTMTGLSIGTTYYVQVGNVTNNNFTINPISIASSPYCSAGANDTTYEKISNVSFGTINNPSTSTGGYENFTAISTSLGKGTSSAFSVDIVNVDSPDQVFVWIDFNQDNDFDDANENVLTTNIGGPFSGTIAIPSTAPLGSTRMRIRLDYTSDGFNGTPCGTSTYGQVEDYTVNIITATACDGTPPGATAAISTTGNCIGGTFNLSATGLSSATGISYQWQSSPNGSGSWNDVVGATSPTYSAAVTEGTTYFKLNATCDESGLTGTSNIVSYTGVACGSVNVPASGFNTVPCGTNTFLYDSAGPTGDYLSDSNGYTVLQNSGTGVISLTGTLASELDYDYFGIYSGTGLGTLLFEYSGSGTIPPFTSAPGQTITVRFDSDSGVTGAGFAMQVNYSGTCAACASEPSELSAIATANAASVSWTAPSPVPTVGYEYAVTTSATPPASGTSTTATSATVGSLTSNADYYLHVRAVCTGPLFSPWATYAFSTPCNSTTTLPSTEGFEGNAPCWTVNPISGNNWALYTSINTEVPSAHTGDAFAGIAWDSGTDTDALLISPPYDLSANGSAAKRVKVWIYRSNTGVAADRITVMVNTTPTIAGATTLLDIPRKRTLAPTETSNNWFEYSATIPAAYDGGTFYVIARGVEGGTGTNYSLGLDDFTLEFTPPTIAGFSPASMCANGTDAQRTVTITGTHFTGATAVNVNGTSVQSFVVDSDTQITAVVSSSSTSGTVSVTGLGGIATSAATLTIYQSYPFYADNDSDGFGAGSAVNLCAQNASTPPAGYVVNNTDCNDNDATVNTPQSYFVDADGDGFGSSTTMLSCTSAAPEGAATNNTDCNDDDATVNTPQSYFVDADGDGFGSTTTMLSCTSTAPAGAATNNTDCNDDDATVNTPQSYYVDADGDGFGSTTTMLSCTSTAPTGAATNDTDCDDTKSTVHPGAAEIGYNLIDDDCDGSIDEGFPPKNSSIQSVLCNTLLPTLDTQIFGGLIAGAQGYQWRVTTMSGINSGQVQYLNTSLRVMKLTQLASYAYDTTYRIEIAVFYAGYLQPYFATTCSVTTPAATTSLANCAQLLTRMTDVIYATNVPFATGYRFRVSDGVNTTILDRALREFRMNLITDFQPKFNKQYTVEIAVRNTDGQYLPYGPACTINTPVFPTSYIQDSQCDDYAPASANTYIYAVSYPGAIAYAFTLTGPGLPVEGVEVVKSTRAFRLSDFTGLIPGATYNVRVRLIFDENDAVGPSGKVCTVVTPGLARMVEQPFTAVAYPNPFADSFSIEVTTSATDKINVKVYDMTGRLLGQNTVEASEMKSLTVGDRFPSGVYNVIVSQGEEVKTLRVVKR